MKAYLEYMRYTDKMQSEAAMAAETALAGKEDKT